MAWKQQLIQLIEDIQFTQQELKNEAFMTSQITHWVECDYIQIPYSPLTAYTLIKDKLC